MKKAIDPRHLISPRDERRKWDDEANPIESRPERKRKEVVSAVGSQVGTRSGLSEPEEPEVGFDAVPPEKKKAATGRGGRAAGTSRSR